MAKQCGRCAFYLDETCFGKSSKSKDGLRSMCKACRHKEFTERSDVTREKARLTSERWYNSGKHRNAYYLRHFGITEADYNRMVAEQNGVCAVCKKPPGVRRLHVDHNHGDSGIRGLLCGSCNRGIGYLQDDPVIAQAATDYLKKNAKEMQYEPLAFCG